MKSIIPILLLCSCLSCYGQKNSKDSTRFRFTFSSGISGASVKDKNISAQQYTGHLAPIVLNWRHLRTNHTWDLTIRYQTGTVSNHNVPANLDDIGLIWKYTYRLKNVRLFNRPATIFGGFSPNLWIYNRKQNIAEPAQFLYSLKALVNMNLHTGLKGNLTKKLGYQVAADINLLSYGVSLEIYEGNPQIAGKLSTAFSTPLMEWGVSFDYTITHWLHAGIGYTFRYYKHQDLKLATDSFTGSISATF